MRTVVSLLVVAFLAYWVHGVYVNVAEKVASADLMAASGRHLADRDPHAPIIYRIEKGTQHVLLGVPSGVRQEPYDWIILDATIGGGVARRPIDGHFNLTCSYLTDLTQKESIDPAVHDFLLARCRRDENTDAAIQGTS